MQRMRPFVDWLLAELEYRGWSRSEAARRGRISPSMIDKVIGGFSAPGLHFCESMARAFEMPLEDIFRLAGILPPLSDSDPSTAQLLQRLDALPGPIRQHLVTIITAALDMAQLVPSSGSLVPASQIQTRDDLVAWMDSLPTDERRIVWDAMELSFAAFIEERTRARA